MKARALTAWLGDGFTAESAFRPALRDDYAVTIEDVTAQPVENLTPAPNMLVVEIETDAATVDAIDADPAYTVLWRE